MRPRVLVLEDEPLIAMMLCDWLGELGCEIAGPAGTVKDALELLQDSKLAGAILDVTLKGGDCAAVADRLRDQGVPFAFATGHAASQITSAHAQAPVLAKPYDFAAVQGIVARMLGCHAAP